MTAPGSPCGVITLLTDFGLADPFVGVMKGVILSRFPAARVIDLCHGIRPQAIREAAFWLERCHSWFPPGTVHVAVVDPGVGTTRRVLAAALGGQYFLVPDNGLLPERLVEAPGGRVLGVDLARHGLEPHSATFHGRDVFVPLAAALSSGALDFDALGEPVQPLPCELARPTRDARGISGEVVTIDHFGNLLTNLDESLLAGAGIHHAIVGERRLPLRRTYGEAEPGELMALVNAFGVLEIAERDGSAERTLGIGRGGVVRLPLERAPVA